VEKNYILRSLMICSVHQYYSVYQIKNEVDAECSIYGGEERCIQNFGGKTEEKRPFGILVGLQVQWSLYVLHSGQCMYRTVVTICTAQWSLYVPPSCHYIYTAQWLVYVPPV
jgi:hypothetical protein